MIRRRLLLSSRRVEETAQVPADESVIVGTPVSRRERTMSAVAAAFCICAVALTLVIHLATLNRPFDLEHAWIDAAVSTMARTFATEGLLPLHFVPIENNPPMGLEPDPYIHASPLYPAALSILFRIFGAEEAVGRATMLANVLALACVAALLSRRLFGAGSMLFAAGAALLFPVTAQYGYQLMVTSIGVTLTSIAVCIWIEADAAEGARRQWLLVAVGAVGCLAAWTAWEPVFFPLGLILAALIRRDRRRITEAVILTVAVGSAAALVLAVYLATYPHHFRDLWQAVLDRTGMATFPRGEITRLHEIVDAQLYSSGGVPIFMAPWRMLMQLQHLGQIGAAAFLAAIAASYNAVRNRSVWGAPFLALAFPWLCWFVLMRNYVFHNQFMVLAVPLAAVAVSAAIQFVFRRFSTGYPLVIVLPALIMMMQPALAEANRRIQLPKEIGQEVVFGRAIRAAVDRSAIVMVAGPSMVPVYYSERHIVRGVSDAATAVWAAEKARQVFPGADIYFAAPAGAREATSLAGSRRFTEIRSGDDLALYRFRDGG